MPEPHGSFTQIVVEAAGVHQTEGKKMRSRVLLNAAPPLGSRGHLSLDESVDLLSLRQCRRGLRSPLDDESSYGTKQQRASIGQLGLPKASPDRGGWLFLLSGDPWNNHI
jgi:hypothetical protein